MSWPASPQYHSSLVDWFRAIAGMWQTWQASVVCLSVIGWTERPLWMLPEPARLHVDEGYPLHQGRLQILDGPERLETGWWDEDSIARDYYTAINPRGMRLWVFRTRNRDADWYLHGFFG